MPETSAVEVVAAVAAGRAASMMMMMMMMMLLKNPFGVVAVAEKPAPVDAGPLRRLVALRRQRRDVTTSTNSDGSGGSPQLVGAGPQLGPPRHEQQRRRTRIFAGERPPQRTRLEEPVDRLIERREDSSVSRATSLLGPKQRGSVSTERTGFHRQTFVFQLPTDFVV